MWGMNRRRRKADRPFKPTCSRLSPPFPARGPGLACGTTASVKPTAMCSTALGAWPDSSTLVMTRGYPVLLATRQRTTRRVAARALQEPLPRGRADRGIHRPSPYRPRPVLAGTRRAGDSCPNPPPTCCAAPDPGRAGPLAADAHHRARPAAGCGRSWRPCSRSASIPSPSPPSCR